METSETVKEIRSRTGLNRKEFCQKFGIPLRTMEEWETGRRIPPEYIPRMLAYYTTLWKMRKEIKLSLSMIYDLKAEGILTGIQWNSV